MNFAFLFFFVCLCCIVAAVVFYLPPLAPLQSLRSNLAAQESQAAAIQFNLVRAPLGIPTLLAPEPKAHKRAERNFWRQNSVGANEDNQGDNLAKAKASESSREQLREASTAAAAAGAAKRSSCNR